jgi:hypothetical protein
MKKSACAGVLWMALVLLTSQVPVRAAEQPVAISPAPVPSQIMAAKKMFISNAQGEKIDARIFFLPTFSPTQPYDAFYAAIKSGGRFDPVLAPADADLVLEIRFTDEFIPGVNNVGGNWDLRLAIRDPKTNVLLWALSRPVVAAGGFGAKEKRETNFNQAMAALVGDLNLLASQSSAAASPSAK